MARQILTILKKLAVDTAHLPGRIHSNERGSISVASVFALLLLVYLLGMVINSSRQVDHRVRMQNAADAATYSGGIVITRNMNTLAFTNHMLSDVFAITAFMREARDRKAESLTPEILANWQRVGPAFTGSPFPKFDQLGPAITEKVPHEAEMIQTYSDWAAAASELMLPVFEEILAQRMIPEFQRSLVEATPQMAQFAADEVARRHGQSWPQSTQLRAVLWRTIGDPVGGSEESTRRTMPVVDPVMDEVPNQATYVSTAKRQRDSLAYKYLRDWNAVSLEVFDEYGRMSQFSNLWRIFTRGNLKQLLNEEYPNTNLPFQIRTPVSRIEDLNRHLEQDFMFVGVVYRKQIKNHIPGIFKNPVESDTQAYAQIMLFVPRRRLLKWYPGSSTSGGSRSFGVPGQSGTFGVPRGPIPPPGPSNRDDPDSDSEDNWFVTREYRWTHLDRESASAVRSRGVEPIRWDILNQNWTMQMTPATSQGIPKILSRQPYVNGVGPVKTPNLEGLSVEDLQWLSHH